jgi:hypothetical protein
MGLTIFMPLVALLTYLKSGLGLILPWPLLVY